MLQALCLLSVPLCVLISFLLTADELRHVYVRCLELSKLSLTISSTGESFFWVIVEKKSKGRAIGDFSLAQVPILRSPAYFGGGREDIQEPGCSHGKPMVGVWVEKFPNIKETVEHTPARLRRVLGTPREKPSPSSKTVANWACHLTASIAAHH